MNLPLKSLYIDLNSFFASVEQQSDPALRGKPVAVVPVETDATCAIAASYEAKSFGIKTGTPVWEAKKRCPELICVLADHQGYVETHHHIAAVVDQFIPVAEVASIDEFACELQGRQQEESAARALAQEIRKAIYRQVGEAIHCSIGISTNTFLAKVATDLQKPDGLVVLRPEDMPGRMQHCKLTDLTGIGRNMLKRLRIQGVGDIPALWAKTPKQMRALWGSVEGERYWYKLHGIEIPRYETERRTIGHSHVLAPEFRPPPAARIVAQRLLQKAASRLRRLDYAASHLVLSVRLENGPRLSAEARFSALSDTPALMQQLLFLWQEVMQAMGSAPLPIKKVSLALYGLVPAAQVTPDLFEWQQTAASRPNTEKREAVSRAMDRLNQRFGRDSIVQGFAPKGVNHFSGTKIAFTRIPDLKEFQE